jgi:hypothetical protein
MRPINSPSTAATPKSRPSRREVPATVGPAPSPTPCNIFEQFYYHVCFEAQSPRATVCSAVVAGPKAGVDIQTKAPPSGDMTKPFDPGIGIQVKPGAGNLDMMKG